MEFLLTTLLWTIGVLLTVILSLYAYFRHVYTYWKKKGVAYLEPAFPFGNVSDTMLQRKAGAFTFRELYWRLEGKDFGGIYSLNTPTVIFRSPELIKDMLVKSFMNFQDRGIYFDEKTDPLSAHLFNLGGRKWRNLRVKLTPTFTSGKIKAMFSILTTCGDGLRSYLDKYGQEEIIEVKDVLARFTTDIIASFAYGIECNCLKNPAAEFREWGMKTFKPRIQNGIRNVIILASPTLASILKIPLVSKEITHYFTNMVKQTVEYREKNNQKRNDFLQLLIEMKNQEPSSNTNKYVNGNTVSSENEFDVTIDVIAAQAFVFFIAGFETSSTTMSFCLYELALNPDIQKRVHLEIDSVLKKHNNEITYESLQEMTYLDRVVSETLRKYPPVPFLPRQCTQPYKIPGTDVVIEKGTPTVIPILAIHYDSKYFPNPERFDPDRFSDEVKSKRHPFTYLPFGEGPRICIGMRFGLLQTKMGLVSWLHKNEVKVCEKTTIPMKYESKTFLITSLGGIYLKNVKRKAN